jgi:hypothetical protein
MSETFFFVARSELVASPMMRTNPFSVKQVYPLLLDKLQMALVLAKHGRASLWSCIL